MSGTERNGVLLMICYKFPPMHSISCRRTWALHEEFKKRFAEVHVISTTNRHVLTKSDIRPEGAQVHDAATRDYRTVLQSGGKKHLLIVPRKFAAVTGS